MDSVNKMETDVVTEVPDNLKRLVRYVLRGFYPIEHALTMDLLLHHPCIKEDDIIELLKLERKQLRAVINTLKTDKFLKTRMRVETDAEGKTTRHNYYFINFSLFVNVVKYKLDHMQRKIETEERDATNRASYKCPSCEKCFTDLDADQLIDPLTGVFRCTFCNTEVEEESSNIPKTDARKLMITFNEQMEPLYNLLREVEDIKLSQDILEPEPTDLNDIHKGTSKTGLNKQGQKTSWSGDSTKNIKYGLYNDQVTINLGEDTAAKDNVAKKERPVWMVESTVAGASTESLDTDATRNAAGVSNPGKNAAPNEDDIMKTLLAHEKKNAGPQVAGVPLVPGSDEDTSTSESEDETQLQSNLLSKIEGTSYSHVEEMESENDDDPMVTLKGARVSYHDITQDMVEQMNAEEKAEYIRVGREMYQDMYD